MTRARDVADTQDNTGGAVAPFVAGKNKIINGDFGIWQRGTTFNGIATETFTADRFRSWFNGTGATRNLSQQTFTPGSAPVSGYEGTFYHRYAQTVAGTGGSFNNFGQKIEDVRQLAGQTAVFSFWARVSSGTLNIEAYWEQVFGSGGSGATYTQFGSTFTVTTSWQRFTGVATIPTVSGKTIGTGNYATTYIALPSNTTFTLDTWGFQVEAGSVATAFQTATGTPAGELAACQRYYERIVARGGATVNYSGVGHYYNTTDCYVVQNYVTKRTTTPTMTFSSNTDFTANSAGANRASTLVAADIVAANAADYYIRTASVTAGASAVAGISNAAGWIAIEAEL